MDSYLTNLLLYLIIIIIPLMAQIRITYSYKKYKKIDNDNGLTGFEIARKILDANNLSDVYVVEVQGDLTDHYDPTRKTVRLSSDIFHGTSIASSSVAVHECGHAIQDSTGYIPMRIRSMLVPVVNLVSYLSWYVILIGLIARYYELFIIGIGLISIGLLFQIITLPVEINASKRAIKELDRLSLVNKEETLGAKRMLTSAALTYVASVLTSILEIFRLLLMYGNRRK